MKDLSASYPGREYRERWVTGMDNIPQLVQAFECPNYDDPWENVCCPEAGFSCAYVTTHDTEADAWDEGMRLAAKKRDAALKEYEGFIVAYRRYLNR